MHIRKGLSHTAAARKHGVFPTIKIEISKNSIQQAILKFERRYQRYDFRR